MYNVHVGETDKMHYQAIYSYRLVTVVACIVDGDILSDFAKSHLN